MDIPIYHFLYEVPAVGLPHPSPLLHVAIGKNGKDDPLSITGLVDGFWMIVMEQIVHKERDRIWGRMES